MARMNKAPIDELGNGGNPRGDSKLAGALAVGHTPGPWIWLRADKAKGGKPPLWGDVPHPVDCLYAPATEKDGWASAVLMAQARGYSPDDEGVVNEADARLIAAAPDLLAALEAASDIVLQHNLLSTASDEDRRETIDRLIDWLNGPRLAAIAKATA